MSHSRAKAQKSQAKKHACARSCVCTGACKCGLVGGCTCACVHECACISICSCVLVYDFASRVLSRLDGLASLALVGELQLSCPCLADTLYLLDDLVNGCMREPKQAAIAMEPSQ